MNLYGRQLTPDEISRGAHRDFVGGMWEEIGALQLDFLRARGLAPHHRFVDVGCGALRGGLHFIRYLDAGNYHGLDINPSLLEAGRAELRAAGLEGKQPRLEADAEFRLSRFGQSFDFGLALSVFTHLPMNPILRCLKNVQGQLSADGVFFASYFPAPSPAHLEAITHQPGGVRTFSDADPFHYGLAELEWMAATAGLAVVDLGDWGHPRGQRMLAFRRLPG
jgi:SAM-dependent methyltransferase